MTQNTSGPILTRCHYRQDADYIEAVTAVVQRHYTGEGPLWCPPPSSELWSISMGGRAGVVGVRVMDRSCCVKLFYDSRWSTRLRTFFGYAKAKKAYRHAVCLQEAGIACPKPIGYVEHRPWGPGIVITELIEKGLRLDLWITKHGVDAELIKVAAGFLRDMHDRGITHKDLSPRNLLVQSHGRLPQILVLDYEDARFSTNEISEVDRLADLHHLDERALFLVSLRHRLRFLRLYAGENYGDWCEKLKTMLEHSHTKYARAYKQHLRKTKQH